MAWQHPLYTFESEEKKLPAVTAEPKYVKEHIAFRAPHRAEHYFPTEKHNAQKKEKQTTVVG